MQVCFPLFLNTIDGMWDEFKIDGFETPITSLSFGPPSYSIQQLRTIEDEAATLPALRFAVGAEDGVVYEWIKEGKFIFCN